MAEVAAAAAAIAGAAESAIGALNGALDLAQKIQTLGDKANNIKIYFENRTSSYFGTIDIMSEKGKTGQDWELINPFLPPAVNIGTQANPILKPTCAVSVTNIVQDQKCVLNIAQLEGPTGHLMSKVGGSVSISFTTPFSGMWSGYCSVQIVNAAGTVLLDVSNEGSFAKTVIDWGAGPLGFSVGWAANKYILHVVMFNISLVA